MSDFQHMSDDEGNLTIVEWCGEAGTVKIPKKILGKQVVAIGNSAFYNCKTVKRVEVPEGVKTIGPMAFYGCANLAKVKLPEDLLVIGNMAFHGCAKLRELVLPDSVTRIGNLVLEGCVGLKSVTMPRGLKSLGHAAFRGCEGLGIINLPDNLLFFKRHTGWPLKVKVNMLDSVAIAGFAAADRGADFLYDGKDDASPMPRPSGIRKEKHKREGVR